MKRISRALLTFSLGFLVMGIVLATQQDMTVRGALQLLVFGLAFTSFAAAIICNDQPPRYERPGEPNRSDGAQI